MTHEHVPVTAVRALARLLAMIFPSSIRAASNPSFADVAEHRWRRERRHVGATRATMRTAAVLLRDITQSAPAFWRASFSGAASSSAGAPRRFAMFRRWLGVFGALRGLSLDLKLGVRMLVKYPGLTVIGGVAMAFAICVGVVIVQVLSFFMHPTLPLPQGDRLAQIRYFDVAANSLEDRTLYDFQIWRNSLRSMTELGAWRNAARNLIVDKVDAGQVQVAEISPSAFRVADGTPLMGRVLTEADERPAAPAVAVIGYDVWKTQLGGDPAVLGRTVQLGAEHVAIVGVMREGFAFPIAHDVWTPFRYTNDVPAPRSGPRISVFGLVAPEATFETAQAELTTIGQRLANELPATHAHLRVHVMPYAELEGGNPADDDETGVFAMIYVFAGMLTVLICSNVALLLFARAATRESELAMRTALGASRGRIVVQMFTEALVLGGLAAAVGLGAAHIALTNWGVPFLEANYGRLPFWFDLSLSTETVAFAFVLTILGSAIAGVLPALKVTRGIGTRLKQSTAGAGGLQFGGIWTLIIVVQVAFTMAFPALVYQQQWLVRRAQTFDAGFPIERYLTAEIELDASLPAGENTTASPEAHARAFATRIETLRQRVASQPGVAGVTFADGLPRTWRPNYRIELPDDVDPQQQTAADTAAAPFRVATLARIDPSYFDTLDTRVLAGRAFTAADLLPGANVAIVDQSFVDQVLRGRNAVGQQLRFRARSSDPPGTTHPWIEIVGVVKELGMGNPQMTWRAAGLYLPSTPERLDQVHMMVHLRGEPLDFVPELREIALAVDPALRVSDVQRIDQVTDGTVWVLRLVQRVTMVMTAVAIVLSLSGIYAVLSFIVARRTREIGVRVALGADRRRVVMAIFRRPLIQVAVGVTAGVALLTLAGTVKTEMPGFTGELSARQLALLGAYGVVMFGVCLLACIVPTRRALRVQPTIALRME